MDSTVAMVEGKISSICKSTAREYSTNPSLLSVGPDLGKSDDGVVTSKTEVQKKKGKEEKQPTKVFRILVSNVLHIHQRCINILVQFCAGCHT